MLKRGFLIIILKFQLILHLQASLKKHGTIKAPKGSIKKIMSHFHKFQVILLTNTYLESYKLSPKLKFQYRIPIKMDLNENYVSAGIDKGGEVYIFSKKEVRNYDDQNKYKLTSSAKINQIPEVDSFSKMIDFNDFDLKFAMKSGRTNRVFEWDYRRSTLSIFRLKTENYLHRNVMYLKFIDNGFKIAVIFSDDSIVAFDSNTLTEAYIITSKDEAAGPNLRRIENCDFAKNFVVQKGNKEIMIYESSTGNLRGTIKLSTSLTRLTCPRGTSTLLAFSKTIIFVINLENFNFVDQIVSPSGEWFNHISGTSYFSTKSEEKDDSKNEINEIYNFYNYDKKNPLYCHTTCEGECKHNFRPCLSLWNFWFIYFCCLGICLVVCLLFSQTDHIFRILGDKIAVSMDPGPINSDISLTHSLGETELIQVDSEDEGEIIDHQKKAKKK